MPETTTMTIRVRSDVKQKLDQLAHDTRRSRSFLAADAVSAYVDRELAIINGILQGVSEVKDRHTIPHDQAMSEIYAVLETGSDQEQSK